MVPKMVYVPRHVRRCDADRSPSQRYLKTIAKENITVSTALKLRQLS